MLALTAAAQAPLRIYMQAACTRPVLHSLVASSQPAATVLTAA